MTKYIMILFVAMFTVGAYAGFRGLDNDNINKGSFTKIQCGTNLNCSESSGKFLMEPFDVVSKSATATLTAAECGSVVVATADISLTLPAATATGCKFRIVNVQGGTSAVDLHPASGESIYPLSSADNFYRSVAQGASVDIVDVSSGLWITTSSFPDFTDFDED